MKYRNDIRNIAIIAHVDHGKTTMVDALLKQSKIFRENQHVADCVLDSNALEREKGITIMAKNTAIMYKGVKINIIDTPGHADFSGEVERVISMADGCLLLVDSVEGPMPQTKFVLQQAMIKGLKPILIINKIDKKEARVEEVIKLTQDLFLELATRSDQLDFPILYASGRQGWAVSDMEHERKNISPILDCILEKVPPPQIADGPFQMLVTNLDYNSHKGKISIGRIWRGKIVPRDFVVCLNADGESVKYQVDEVFTYMGLSRLNVDEATAGDIVAITGVDKVSIGDTIADPNAQEALPRIEIGEPTIEMTFGVNTSPLGGREGQYCTTRQLRDRLYRELEKNLSLRVQDTDSADTFLVKGRGELHLAILIETMRREGYEFEISKPEAITKIVDGKLMEPVESLIINTSEEYIGILTEILSSRQAQLTDMYNDGKGNVRLEFKIPTKGLIGFRGQFLTSTRGSGVMNTIFVGYEPWKGTLTSTRSGVLIASEAGLALSYGIANAQERGETFIEPNTMVYEGMIVGTTQRSQDIPINICKEKKKTNIRSSTSDIAVKLTPAIKLSLEQAIDYINIDELVEITPENIRLRKKLLTNTQRLRDRHKDRTNLIGPAIVSRWDQNMSDISAIYIHIPFCRQKCKYCSFISYQAREGDIPAYITALKKELELRRGFGDIGSVYFGGGTPSLLSPVQLHDILSYIKGHYSVAHGAEITIEANPGTVKAEYLSDINRAGINRLSLGIQSFNDIELAILGRIHGAAEAREAIADARRAGFDNLSIDLIYGLPGQTIGEWQKNLEEAIKLDPDHLSLYALTLEPEVRLSKEIQQGILPGISSDVAASQYELAEKLLCESGYHHYEISNWAKQGKECRHNLVYWQTGEYLGVGVAAHSCLNRRRTGNTGDLDAYITSLSQNKLLPLDVDETIDTELGISEAIILGLRLCGGINIKEFEKRFGMDIMKNYAKRIEELTDYKLIEFNEGNIRLTPAGRLLGNEVFWRFLPDKV